MRTGFIEHVNVTVSQPERSARLFEELFGWRVRWHGPARDGGTAIHVGDETNYIAVYAEPRPRDRAWEGQLENRDWPKGAPLNHVGIQVEDLDAVERRVIAAGLVPFSHGDYEPGRRFYFMDWDGIEFEIVSYA
ncbi:MAG TPA: VOC family protein [Allosphingosinicella sp.]|nr:VOC family protein [Allosphingosinicella sp.]